MLSRFVIAFLRRSRCLLISWLQSPSAVILEPRKIKSDTVSTVSPSVCHEVIGPDAVILVYWMLSLKPAFSLSSFSFIKRLFSSSSLSAIRVVSSVYLRLLIFLPLGIQKNWNQHLKKISTFIIIIALFTITKMWKQHKCPLTVKWLNKMWYIHTMKY